MIQLKNAKELAVMRRACEISALALRRGGRSDRGGHHHRRDRQDHLRLYQTAGRQAQLQGPVRLSGHRVHQRQRRSDPRHPQPCKGDPAGRISSASTQGLPSAASTGTTPAPSDAANWTWRPGACWTSRASRCTGALPPRRPARGWAISATRCRPMWRKRLLGRPQFCGPRVWAKELHEDPEVPNFGPAGAPPPCGGHDPRH